MYRRALVALIASLTLMAGDSAYAGAEVEHAVTFHTSSMCATACPWEILGQADFLLNASTKQGSHLGADAACQKTPPAAPGSFDQIRVTAPRIVHGERTRFLRFSIRPWEASVGLVCGVDRPATVQETYRYLAVAQTGRCTQGPLGNQNCYTEADVPVLGGKTYVLRIYNDVDLFTLKGAYAWCSSPCSRLT